MKGVLLWFMLLASTVSCGISDEPSNDTPVIDDGDEVICQIRVLDIQFEDQASRQEYRCVIEKEEDDVEADMTYALELDEESVAGFEEDLDAGNMYATIPQGRVSRRKKGSIDQVIVPQGTEIKLSKGRPEQNSLVRRRRRKAGPENSRRLTVRKSGTSTVLVIRVSAADHKPSLTAKQLSNRIFGTDGDQVNLVSVYDSCSAGKLKFIPATGANIVNGVGEIELNQNVDGMRSIDVDNLVVAAGNAKFGALSIKYDHVMLCFPPGTNGDWLAYAYLNWYRSSYNDKWCGYPSAQVHEVGHNLGLMHSGEGSTTYGDQSGLMGYSYERQQGPKMCFNGHKNWILGWYDDRSIVVDPKSDGAWTGKLAAFVDYEFATSQSENVLIKVGDLHLQYNRKKGFNSGTLEKADKITVTEGKRENQASKSLAGLGDAGTYRYTGFDGTNDLIIQVCGIYTNEIPNYVRLSIFIEGPQSHGCDEVLSSSPTTTPSQSPSIFPTSKPSLRPSLFPSVGPSNEPSVAASADPSAVPTSHSLDPSRTPSSEPSVGPTSSTGTPTVALSAVPSSEPSVGPTSSTGTPTVALSAVPSSEPLVGPTSSTGTPTVALSAVPSSEPSLGPTSSTGTPVVALSAAPSVSVSASPSDYLGKDLDCRSDQILFQLSITTDQYPAETEWELTNTGKTYTLKGGPYGLAKSEYMEGYCVPEDVYVFQMKDKYGDGMCCEYGAGSYTVSIDGLAIASGGQFRQIEYTTIMPLCDSDEDRIMVQVSTDYFGSETSWTLETLSGTEVMSGTDYGSRDTRKDTQCIDSSECYVFTIRDQWGDGMCCSYGFGGYQIQFASATYEGNFVEGYEEAMYVGASCPASATDSTSDSAVSGRRRHRHKASTTRQTY